MHKSETWRARGVGGMGGMGGMLRQMIVGEGSGLAACWDCSELPPQVPYDGVEGKNTDTQLIHIFMGEEIYKKFCLVEFTVQPPCETKTALCCTTTGLRILLYKQVLHDYLGKI